MTKHTWKTVKPLTIGYHSQYTGVATNSTETTDQEITVGKNLYM